MLFFCFFASLSGGVGAPTTAMATTSTTMAALSLSAVRCIFMYYTTSGWDTELRFGALWVCVCARARPMSAHQCSSVMWILWSVRWTRKWCKTLVAWELRVRRLNFCRDKINNMNKYCCAQCTLCARLLHAAHQFWAIRRTIRRNATMWMMVRLRLHRMQTKIYTFLMDSEMPVEILGQFQLAGERERMKRENYELICLIKCGIDELVGWKKSCVSGCNEIGFFVDKNK